MTPICPSVFAKDTVKKRHYQEFLTASHASNLLSEELSKEVLIVGKWLQRKETKNISLNTPLNCNFELLVLVGFLYFAQLQLSVVGK